MYRSVYFSKHVKIREYHWKHFSCDTGFLYTCGILNFVMFRRRGVIVWYVMRGVKQSYTQHYGGIWNKNILVKISVTWVYFSNVQIQEYNWKPISCMGRYRSRIHVILNVAKFRRRGFARDKIWRNIKPKNMWSKCTLTEVLFLGDELMLHKWLLYT